MDDDQIRVHYAMSQMHALDAWIFSNLTPEDERPVVDDPSTYSPNLYFAKDEHIPGFINLTPGQGVRKYKEGRLGYVDGTFVGM
ncbi:hypothetical protein DXG03_000985 [Asterophora parasitica]|uniref:Uncharacterized protein n=1 Tax=Asterophora parasitica TaxID=117018 RepID=A0A9P7GAD7_9AGAR|nr:hypothetical protein DXG03_000985 [Asterophora parasitica]